MSKTLTPVWVREEENLSAPADEQRKRVKALEALTQSIESTADEPAWDASISDRELLGEERKRRFGRG
ncbi:MAG: hypothetical protein LKK22_07205 [Olsenella sp.]|jgi:hypothetical protein|nr:hypothetical protein [Olsenella sp.]MCI1666409.1 hypothetical protein [Olsenella sp.]MCI2127726.1 hypothetical protein [Olsenella sp.]